MLLGAIRLAFCVVIAILAFEISAGLVIGTGMVLGAIVLFNYGCGIAANRAATRARQDTLNSSENTLDLIITATGAHQDTP